MKISITDTGSGIAAKLAVVLGAGIQGRFIHIPESKGSGYITGFSWGTEMRMMIRNYYLKEEVFIARTNELATVQDDIVFLLSGIFPSLKEPGAKLVPEQANLMICKHAVSSVMDMPSNTLFGSVTIAVSKKYLSQLFGHIDHPVVVSVLEADTNFVIETGITQEIMNVASDFLQQSLPESLESRYHKLKCEELLCYIFAVLMQRDAVAIPAVHMNDIKAVYAIKLRLQSKLSDPPNIAALAKEAGMSEPKLRKLFKQTFGKGIFEYYQSARMQEAAKLLREKHLTVSETGYQLGFTNLSHFSRVFEQHIGSKPKKYRMLFSVRTA